MRTAEQVAAVHIKNGKQAACINTVEVMGDVFSLNVCQGIDGAFFQWVDQDGDDVGDPFLYVTMTTHVEFERAMATASIH